MAGKIDHLVENKLSFWNRTKENFCPTSYYHWWWIPRRTAISVEKAEAGILKRSKRVAAKSVKVMITSSKITVKSVKVMKISTKIIMKISTKINVGTRPTSRTFQVYRRTCWILRHLRNLHEMRALNRRLPRFYPISNHVIAKAAPVWSGRYETKVGTKCRYSSYRISLGHWSVVVSRLLCMAMPPQRRGSLDNENSKK